MQVSGWNPGECALPLPSDLLAGTSRTGQGVPLPAMPSAPAPVSSNRFMRALDTWGLVTLIAAASIAQLGWTATGVGGHHDTSRPGLVACVFLQTNHKEPIRTGTKCNAIDGFCVVTLETACSEVGPVPYLGALTSTPTH